MAAIGFVSIWNTIAATIENYRFDESENTLIITLLTNWIYD